MDSPKPKNSPGQPSSPSPKAPAAPTAVETKLPPMFRRVDWLTLLIAFGVVWVVYFLTLAPEVTLEDSGELCTGAYYAGIPHPPGYPFWSIYSYFWSNFLPFGNVAWRVEVGESTAAAMACGLVALMISRGSSMLIEGIEDLKGLSRKWENGICIVCGAVTGIMLGLGRTMWSESVAINRISLFGIPWVMLVLLCLMRWIYAPRQLRYLFTAMFLFGICGTIHQTLLCAALGIEAAIAITRPRLGRMFFLANSIVFLMGMIAKLTQLTDKLNDLDHTLLSLYVGVGIASILLYFWFAFMTKEGFQEFCRDGTLVASALLFVFAVSQGLFGKGLFYTLLSVASFVGFFKFAWDTRKLGLEWLVVLGCAALGGLGLMFYLYEPLAGMSDPPMQWGYPRTVDGFWHALSRGQYEKAHPTDLLSANGLGMFVKQLGLLASGIAEEYNWVLLFVALVPLLFYFKMKKRERCWLVTLTGMYFCIGVLLVILMNPQDDRQSVDLHRVFFASSHGVVAIMIGYGMALATAYMAMHYRSFRVLGLSVGGVALVPALITLYYALSNTFFGGAGQPKFNWVLLAFLVITAAFVLAALAAQMLLRSWKTAGPGSPPAIPAESGDQRFYAIIFASLSVLCLALAAYLAFGTPVDSPGFGTLMAAAPSVFPLRVPILPALAGVLVVGIVAAFVAGLLVYRNRAPLALTLGLFALMPVASVMSHWATSEQRGHWFGYWFGHDMFTPPFTGPDGKLTYDPQLRAEALKGTNAALVYPEMPRNAILYGGTDPGRFCPEYMIYCESFTAHSQQPIQDQHYDRRDVYIITQNALADGTYLEFVRSHYNRSTQKDPPFFQELLRSDEERKDYTTNRLARLAYELLDKPFTKLGANIEARRRAEGVYPPKEIYIATPDDLQQSIDNYRADLQARYAHDQNPQAVARDGRLVKDGEIREGGGNNITVMAINGLLTKVMFDHNPTNDFFVEESFPLDWMFPHLTPFGDIMRINRQPLAEMPESEVRRDHEFWSHNAERLVGNWITYDTTVQEIVDFVQKVYVRHDFTGFKGNRRFIRDDQAQKAFSKLRVAVGGIYAWRLGLLGGVPTPKQYNDQVSGRPEAAARMLKEADFAYRQAFAFCPYSAEVVGHYIQLLVNTGRIDDAILITKTCHELDPNYEYMRSLYEQLLNMKTTGGLPPAGGAPTQASLAPLQKKYHDNPSDFQNGFALVQAYIHLQQMPEAVDLLDQMLSNTNADVRVVATVVDAFSKLNDFVHLEPALQKMTQVQPETPENWYNLAGLEAIMGKNDAALKNLRRAIEDSDKRLAKEPKANNLRANAATNAELATLRQLPEFQQLMAAPGK